MKITYPTIMNEFFIESLQSIEGKVTYYKKIQSL